MVNMIRTATIEDCPALGQVHVQSWREAYVNLLPSAYLKGLDATKRSQDWAQALANDEKVLLDFEGPNLLGFAAFGSCRDADADASWGEIAALYYLKSQWGMGRAQLLYQRTSEALKALGFSTLTLWVLEGNARATNFYRKNGFEFDGKTQTEKLGDFQMTELRMVNT